MKQLRKATYTAARHNITPTEEVDSLVWMAPLKLRPASKCPKPYYRARDSRGRYAYCNRMRGPDILQEWEDSLDWSAG